MPDSNQQPPVPRLELYPIELIPCTGRVHTNRSIHTVRWVALVRRAGLNEPAPQERHTPPSLSLDEATFLALCPTPATGWRLTLSSAQKKPWAAGRPGLSCAWKANSRCLPGPLWKVNALPARRYGRIGGQIRNTKSNRAPTPRGRFRRGTGGVRSTQISLLSGSPGFSSQRNLQNSGRGILWMLGRLSNTFFHRFA